MDRLLVIRLAVLPLAITLAPAAVTFHKDVEPVLQARCQACHRPGEAAPMSFLTYSATRPFAKAIRAAVLAKKMPPWFADAPHGTFANDPSLTPQEIETLVAWADSGAPAGNPTDAPPTLRFVEGWSIGQPDTVIEMPAVYKVPAKGVIDYQHIIVPTGFTQDKWVQAVEIRPGDRRVVHHIIAFVRPPGSSWLRDVAPGVPVVDKARLTKLQADEMPEYLLSYTPGRPPVGLNPGQARFIKAGSDIVFQIHYTPNGQPVDDRSKLGLIFAKSAPHERIATLPIANRGLVIPPGAPNHGVEAAITVLAPFRLVRMIPHMHLRGKAFEVRVVEEGASPEVLLRVPKYDFNWQNAYSLAKEKQIKPGTRIECTGWYDNSSNNPFNPDPKAEVRWGDQSWDEMMLGYVDVAIPVNVDPQSLFLRPPPAPAPPAASVKDRFIGVWSLLAVEATSASGAITRSYGEKPIGRITYDKAGRMSALLMGPDRKKIAALNLRDATEAEARGILQAFTSYYGTFDVDPVAKTVTHHVELALHPNWVGTDLVRTFEFNGDKLILTAITAPGSSTRLVWQRQE